MLRIACIALLCVVALATAVVLPARAGVVISQVYTPGGGGAGPSGMDHSFI